MDLIAAILADPNIASDFKQALSGAEAAKQLRRVAYVSALKRMDWEFEASDDARVWNAGRAALQALRQEQRAIDPDGALWRLHAHPDYQAI